MGKEYKADIIDRITEKSAEKLGKNTPELILQNEIGKNLTSLEKLEKMEGGPKAIEEAIREILQEKWVKELGLTEKEIREWIFENRNAPKNETLTVGYHESGIITEDGSTNTIETVGLKPCVGVILEAINQNGKKVVCLLHFAPQFLNRSPEEQVKHVEITNELLRKD